MNKTERIIIGVVITLLLIGVFGVLAWRSRAVAPVADSQPSGTTPKIKPDLLQSNVVERLKGLDVNGNLPITVGNDETHGEGRNPFE